MNLDVADGVNEDSHDDVGSADDRDQVDGICLVCKQMHHGTGKFCIYIDIYIYIYYIYIYTVTHAAAMSLPLRAATVTTGS